MNEAVICDGDNKTFAKKKPPIKADVLFSVCAFGFCRSSFVEFRLHCKFKPQNFASTNQNRFTSLTLDGPVLHYTVKYLYKLKV